MAEEKREQSFDRTKSKLENCSIQLGLAWKRSELGRFENSNINEFRQIWMLEIERFIYWEGKSEILKFGKIRKLQVTF